MATEKDLVLKTCLNAQPKTSKSLQENCRKNAWRPHLPAAFVVYDVGRLPAQAKNGVPAPPGDPILLFADLTSRVATIAGNHLSLK